MLGERGAWTMEVYVRRLGLGLAGLLIALMASGCELSGGDDGDTDFDAGNDTGGDTAPRCVADGFCDPTCAQGTDPDCPPPTCDCDRSSVCDAASVNSTAACACDPHCAGTSACRQDGVCDNFCPDGTDPDCAVACDCDRVVGRCDAARRESDTPCACDPDCSGGRRACTAGNTCDEYCLARDGDCHATLGSCNYFAGICEADNNHSTNVCTDDPDCGPGDQACSSDGHCDTFCDPPNASPPPEFDCKDPDCRVTSTGECRR
jgi:hypothetical protein